MEFREHLIDLLGIRLKRFQEFPALQLDFGIATTHFGFLCQALSLSAHLNHYLAATQVESDAESRHGKRPVLSEGRLLRDLVEGSKQVLEGRE